MAKLIRWTCKVIEPSYAHDMRAWRKYRRPAAVIAVGLVVFIAGSYLLKLLGLDTNAFAAVASAGAAIAAFLSAQQSSATARDAVRALSWATKPTLQARLFNYDRGQEPLLMLENVSTHAVSRATVKWRLRDGSTGVFESQGIEALKGPYDPAAHQTRLAPHERIPLGPSLYGVNGHDVVTVDYWGPNGGNGWRLVWEGDFTFQSDGKISSFSTKNGLVSDAELV